LHVHCTNTLTDDEVHAYRLHPQTFFGVVKDNVNREAKTVIELFDFMFETYQHTSKEKLLEFLAGMPDYQQLVKQNQRDLAITYCERMALHMDAQRRSKEGGLDVVKTPNSPVPDGTRRVP
jgi:hypothetical protein